MNLTEQEKIKRFVSDETMSNAVHSVLLGAFLRPRKDNDVQILAASRIAIDLLEEGWKELKKLKDISQKDTEAPSQTAL